MSCQVQVIASDGSTTIARALLGSASSTSFVTERLAQRLHSRRQHHYTQISGISGITTHSGSRRVVNFKVSPTTRRHKVMAVEAVILPEVTTNVPSTSVPFNNNWKHLSNLQLADPNFSTLGNIDLILGGNVFSCAVLYGRRLGPPGLPSAFGFGMGPGWYH